MATQDAARRAYRFLREKSFSQQPFTYGELAAESSWSPETAKTYISKQLSDVVTRRGGKRGGQLLVKPEFQRLSEERFLSIASQKRELFVDYKRSRYDQVVQYEFLLPLTHESQLRRALDDLFYKDAIRQRLKEISAAQLERWIPHGEHEPDEDYLNRVCEIVSSKFNGYSISHVSGRYLADQLTSRAQAAEMLAREQRYIIDETTAAVRFIIPLESSRQDMSGDFEEVESLGEPEPHENSLEEVSLVRRLFLTVFAEAIVRTVEGEDAIWLLEETPRGRRLYVWRKRD